MTDYEYPAEAKELIEAVTLLEFRAKESERQVKDQLRHVRAIDRAKEEKLRDRDRAINERAAELDRREAELEERIAAFQALREQIGSGSELIGRAWAQYEGALAELEARELEIKSHPAPTAAEAVREKPRARRDKAQDPGRGVDRRTL